MPGQPRAHAFLSCARVFQSVFLALAVRRTSYHTCLSANESELLRCHRKNYVIELGSGVRLPTHLRKMVSHRECLFLEARRTANWVEFDRYNTDFDKKNFVSLIVT